MGSRPRKQPDLGLKSTPWGTRPKSGIWMEQLSDFSLRTPRLESMWGEDILREQKPKQQSRTLLAISSAAHRGVMQPLIFDGNMSSLFALGRAQPPSNGSVHGEPPAAGAHTDRAPEKRVDDKLDDGKRPWFCFDGSCFAAQRGGVPEASAWRDPEHEIAENCSRHDELPTALDRCWMRAFQATMQWLAARVG